MVVRKKSARAKAKAAATKAEDTEPPGESSDAPAFAPRVESAQVEPTGEPPHVPAPAPPTRDVANSQRKAQHTGEKMTSFARVGSKKASFVVRLGGGSAESPPASAEAENGEEERIQEVLAMSVLKVVFGEEVRRLRVQLPRATAESSAWLAAVRRAVQQGLGLCEERCSALLRLSYTDAAGSARVLDASTAFDCAAHFEGGTLRLAADFFSSISPQRREGDILWAARDGRAHIGLAMTFGGLQPILVARGYHFEISIRQHEAHERLVAEAFNGSGVHTALLEDCLDALCSLAHAVAGVPSWHRVELEDGRSLALRLCVELQPELSSARQESSAAPRT